MKLSKAQVAALRAMSSTGTVAVMRRLRVSEPPYVSWWNRDQESKPPVPRLATIEVLHKHKLVDLLRKRDQSLFNSDHWYRINDAGRAYLAALDKEEPSQ